MELSEKQVLEKFRQGNQSSFEMIFRAYYQPLCRYAFTFLKDKEEAEEVVQAAFISVWEKRTLIQIETSLKAYLYRMVRNSCINVLKHEKVKQQHVAHQLYVGDTTTDAVMHTLQAAELEVKITEAMQTLPDQCRLVFQLSRFEELKYQEIADQLKISIKTVENHMGKALKLMREQLKDYLPLFLIFMNNWMP
ncbi:MAG: RNA polymerase sigma-70 factor [Cyclobacteriaceae bacterium]|nr:RNA polymerase sigma-70 factor [Cyclobacteriaceae bacterium]